MKKFEYLGLAITSLGLIAFILGFDYHAIFTMFIGAGMIIVAESSDSWKTK